MEEITIKTPLGLQRLIWKDKALARPEDLTAAEIIDIKERSARLKMSLTQQLVEVALDLELPNLRPMWG